MQPMPSTTPHPEETVAGSSVRSAASPTMLRCYRNNPYDLSASRVVVYVVSCPSLVHTYSPYSSLSRDSGSLPAVDGSGSPFTLHTPSGGSAAGGQKWKPRNKKSERDIQATKYKTAICRQWRETGSCSYGDVCRFAHGAEDRKKYRQNVELQLDSEERLREHLRRRAAASRRNTSGDTDSNSIDADLAASGN